MEHTYFFAVDLGATSGRTILGCPRRQNGVEKN